ncbi:S8 family peptidase [Flavitalea sp.]|nr:S8 family peptidase [Flavitalea sp.]
MKHLFLLACFCLCIITSYGQYSKHIIQLTDKKGTPHSFSNPSTYLSAKSIARRTTQNLTIDSTDLPLAPAYLDSIAAVPNVVIFNKSKWLNQVLIRTNDPAALAKINSFPFVKSIKKVANNSVPPVPVNKFNEPVISLDKPEMLGVKSIQDKLGILQSLNYGNSFGQIHLHEGEFLHNRGYTGKGVEMAVMDAGFWSYKSNPAFDSVRLQRRILGTWDFVANEESVNEDHDHGAACFSIIASNRPGFIVGSAPHAGFWLFRTEDAYSEMPVEEQNWIAAAEFADSAGVKIFSTSLGYYNYDDPSLSYSHAQRDGNTAMITRGADLAAKKGILVMNSAGNSGLEAGENKYVVVPADGDSVVAVGAVDVNGNLGSFSSQGPNGAGKIKPNIVSVGVGTVFAPASGNPSAGSGTSFSNPNMAGLIACLWQAFPERSNMDIIDVVQKSSHKYHSPDNFFGYGIPNFRKAYELLMAQSFKPSFSFSNAALALNWTMNADSSVAYIIERKIPGSSQFSIIDSIKTTHPALALDSYGRHDTLRTTIAGQFIYRVRVVIGKDTSFLSPEYAFTNNWSSVVADSLKLGTSFTNCITDLSWSMRDDSSVVYHLERMLPGTNAYAPMKTFKGTGNYNAGGPKTYTYKDPISSQLTGTFSYRLQVSLGQDTLFYSKPSSFTTLTPCYDRDGYFFTPSPFENYVLAMMNTTAAASKLNVVIHDVNGRVMYRYNGSKPGGYYHVRIPTYNLARGVYIASIQIDNKSVYQQKIVK